MPVCPYLLAALFVNPGTYNTIHTQKNEAAQCLQNGCQMWASKYIAGEGTVYDCGLKGEPRV